MWNAASCKSRKKGKKSPLWKGGKTVDNNGYIMLTKPDHTNSDKRGRILEHRFVMSEYLGRPLERWEHVHHKNGIKDDNRIENLAVVLAKNHKGEVRCPHCLKEFFIR